LADPQVILLNDIDIYARGDVEKIINVTEEKTFGRDKLINSQFDITVKNYRNFYSVDNNRSYFKAINWRYEPLKIYNPDGDLIWNGVIRNIQRDHEKGTAKILTINKLHKQWNEVITYSSSAAETPASAAKNIMDNYSIDYDSGTIQASINQLDANSCYVKVNITEEDDVTVMAAIEKLAEYACADAFSSLDKVYFKHWQQFTGGVKVNILEKDFKVRPKIADLESEIINQFSIPYDGDLGVPITDTNGNNIGNISRQSTYFGNHNLPGFDDGGKEAQIYFTSKAGAQYIGESYIKRTHIDLSTQPRPPWIVDFELKGTHEDWIDLETYFTITFDDESWSSKVFEFFKTEINYNTDSIKLRAVETQV
jgi:hypothetical protein